MNKVEQYIEEQNKIIKEDKEQTLIALGLFEKEYSPDGTYTFPYSERDVVDGKQTYYKKVAIQVTDEEYELILSKKKQVEEIKNRAYRGSKSDEQESHLKSLTHSVSASTGALAESITVIAERCTFFISGMIMLGITILATHMKWNSFGYGNAPYDFFALLEDCELFPLFFFAMVLLITPVVLSVIEFFKTKK